MCCNGRGRVTGLRGITSNSDVERLIAGGTAAGKTRTVRCRANWGAVACGIAEYGADCRLCDVLGVAKCCRV